MNKKEIYRYLRKRKPAVRKLLWWRIPVLAPALPFYVLWRYFKEQKEQVHEIVCIWPERGRRKWQR